MSENVFSMMKTHGGEHIEFVWHLCAMRVSVRLTSEFSGMKENFLKVILNQQQKQTKAKEGVSVHKCTSSRNQSALPYK